MRDLDQAFADAVAQAIDTIGDGVVIANERGEIAWTNESTAEMFQRPTDDLVGQHLSILMEAALGERHDEFMRAHIERPGDEPPNHRRLNIARRADGSTFPVEIALAQTHRPDGRYFTAVIRDASSRAAEEEQREYLIRALADSRQHYFRAATHDALTGLANREYFDTLLPDLIEQARRSKQQVAVAFIDLDRFKWINDTLGHHVGDGVLETTAERMHEQLPEEAICARIGGDEFAVAYLAPTAEAIAGAAEALHEALIGPIHLHGKTVDVGASIGVADTASAGEDPGALLTAADAAMYESKRHGGGVGYHAPAMHRRSERRRRIEQGLRHALAREELVLCYRPVLTLPGEEILAARATLQWNPSREEPVLADELWPIAERLGHGGTFERWMLRRAISDLARLDEFALGHVSITCRLSPRTLAEPDLTATVASALTDYRVPAGRLRVEIAERSLPENGSEAAQTLERLTTLGVRMVIGDFSGGGAPLANLIAAPATALQIDPAILGRATQISGARLLLEGAVALGQRLGLEVTAAGVDSAERHTLALELGCDGYEGPLAAEPLPLRRFVWLARRDERTAA